MIQLYHKVLGSVMLVFRLKREMKRFIFLGHSVPIMFNFVTEVFETNYQRSCKFHQIPQII